MAKNLKIKIYLKHEHLRTNR